MRRQAGGRREAHGCSPSHVCPVDGVAVWVHGAGNSAAELLRETVAQRAGDGAGEWSGSGGQAAAIVR